VHQVGVQPKLKKNLYQQHMPDYQPLKCYEHFQDTACWVGYYEPPPPRFGPPVFHTPHYSSVCKYDTSSSDNSMSINPYITKKKSLSAQIFGEYLAPYHWETIDWSICHPDLTQLNATVATPEDKVKKKRLLQTLHHLMPADK